MWAGFGLTLAGLALFVLVSRIEAMKVDNPERERLKELRRDLQRERADLVGALKQAEKDIAAIAHDVLANPVIEEYTFEVLD